MKIQNLKLVNFGVFNKEINFKLNDDIVLLHGKNFSGKTTVAQALYFGLCGKALNTGVNLKELVSGNKTEAKVEIVFTENDDLYRMQRSTKGNEKLDKLEGDDWQNISNQRSVLPDLNEEQWKTLCFLKEEELGEFLVRKPASRRDLLNQILGVEELLRVQNCFINVRRLAKRKEKAVVVEQAGLRHDSTENYQLELEECKETVLNLEHKLSMPLGETSNKKLYEEWLAQKTDLERSIASKTEEKVRLFAGFSGMAEINATILEINKNLSDYDWKKTDLERIIEKRAEAKSNLKQAQIVLEKIKGLHGKSICPTCQQEVSKTHTERLESECLDQIKSFDKNINQLANNENEARETIALLDELTKKKTDLEHRLEQLETVETELLELDEKLGLIESKIKSISQAEDGNGSGFMDSQKLEREKDRLKSLEMKQAFYLENQKKIENVNLKAKESTINRLRSELVADSIEKTLSTVIGQTLAGAEEKIVNCIYDFEMFKGQKMSLDLEKNKLMPTIDKRNFQTLSGSEKAILYIAMKVALSDLLPGTDFFVFDNPTYHLDDVRQEAMAEYLKSLTPKKQVIVMTSDTKLVELLGNSKRIDL